MRWAALGRWSPVAFMGGGGAIAVVLPLIYLVQEPAGALFALVVVLFLLGAASIMVGLLGLRSVLVDGAPKLARAGGTLVLVFVGLTVMALLVIGTLTLLGDGLGMDVPEAPEFGLATAPLFGAIIVGHVVFGLASWRSRVPSRLVGVLLVSVAVLWIASFVVGMRSMEFDVWDLLAFEVPAIATIVVGHLLRRDHATSDHGGG